MRNKIIAEARNISNAGFYVGETVFLKTKAGYSQSNIIRSEGELHLLDSPDGRNWHHSLELEYYNPFRFGQEVKVFSNTDKRYYRGKIYERIIENKPEGQRIAYKIAWDNKTKKVPLDLLRSWNKSYHNTLHLFPQGIGGGGSIKQGNVGNCYFLAVYEGMLRTGIAQKQLTKMIQEIEPFTWAVTFYDPRTKDAQGNMARITKTINIEDLLKIDNKLKSGRVGDLLMERTFGQAIKEIEQRTTVHVSAEAETRDEHYEPNTMDFASHGTIKKAIEILLGKPSQNVYTRDIDKLRQKLTGYFALDGKQLITAGSTATQDRRMRPLHAYFVQSYQKDTDEIVLINPHDTKSAILIINLTDFIKHFSELRITDISDLPKYP
ncbi:MAG: hypothetical protein WCH76_00720 [Candidatus Riflemargulisbacteria bacterium]